MICKIEKDYSSIDSHKWSDFVRKHPNGSFFQTPEFYTFISKIPTYRPVILAALTDDGAIAGILTGVLQKEKGFLKSKFSSRLIVWGGPIHNCTDKEVTDQLLRSLLQIYSRECIYIEFRNLYSLQNENDYFLKNNFTYSEHLNFVVNTENEKQTAARINDGKRRQIKKSLSNEAVIVENVTIEQVKKFYSILRELYTTKVKKPLPAWSFFEQFFYHPEMGKYFLIEYKGEIVGGIMCPIYKNKAIYEWYIAGEDGKHKGIYPSVLATWAAINYAIKNGLSEFNFLGAGKPNVDYGVRQFKAGFGGDLVAHGRYTRINNKLLYTIGKAGLKVLKMIKKS